MFNKIFNESKLITVNNVELEVFEAGHHNIGNPIFLCHGWPQHAYAWRYQVSELVEAGYHVIIPNQRGYGKSSSPSEISEYDIIHLTDDLVGLLDYYGYKKAIFIGHDWGATVVWNLTLLHPERVDKIINLSVPYLERGEIPWLEFLSTIMGSDYYMVHFNQFPGVADAVLDENKEQFLRNMYRKNMPSVEPQPGNEIINLALSENPLGEPVMSEEDLSVFVSAFENSGFTGSINWYRNLDRNWHILADVDPIIKQNALMIYGDKDPVQKAFNLEKNVPNVDIVTVDAGHWIQEERPKEINKIILDWLSKWNK